MMKNILLFLYPVLLVLFVNINAFTANKVYLPFNGISYYFTTSSDGTSISLVFENLKGEEVYFRIINEKGKIFKEKSIISSGKVKEKIDLSRLPFGKYHFLMNFEDKIMNREFFVSPQKTILFLDSNLSSHQDKFEIAVKNEDLFLLMKNSLNGFIDLKIADYYGNILFKSRFLAGAKKYKKYELDSFPPGQYSVILEFDNRKYLDSFSILE